MSNSLFDIAGKTVLITGSSRGIGLTLARGFAESGAAVILNGRDGDALARTKQELRDEGFQCAAYPFDVTNEKEVISGIERILQESGDIDVLVNNAGMSRRGPLEEISEEDWQAVIDLNLTATWRVSKHVVKRMIERKSGKIINIASLMSFAARPGTGPYVASKGGVSLLTKAMTVEWAPHNIQANAIAPGYFVTDLNRHLAEDPDFDKWVRMRTPAGRWGDLNELKGLAIFLASSASNFISGQTIYVDGGWTSNL